MVQRREVREEGGNGRKEIPSQALPFAAEIVMLDCFVGFGRVPGHFCGVFGSDAVGPGQVIVDLDEVIVSLDGSVGLDAAEEVHHALL